MKHLLVFLAVSVLSSNVIAQKPAPGPHLLVYKTKADYRNLVPVTLSADGLRIVSYPDPKDLKAGGENLLPTKLHKGYLMDNRGIAEHVAFLKMTYRDFSKLPQAPGMNEMMRMIVDKDPLVALCDCGLRNGYKNAETQLNEMIDKKKLAAKCKTLKKK